MMVFLNIIMYLIFKETIIDVFKFAITDSQTGNYITTFILAIIEVICIFILRNIIFIIIYLAYRFTKIKSIKQNTIYTETYGIEYYREKLPQLTASQISLITDLNIENKKDISATLLDLYQKNIIKFENNQIIVEDDNVKNLKQSEKKLLEIITSKKINEQNVEEWKNICIQETIQDGYIRPTRKDRYSYLKNINKVLNTSLKIWGITFVVLIMIQFPTIISETNTSLEQQNYVTNIQTNEQYQENIQQHSQDDSKDLIDEFTNSPIFIVLLIIHIIAFVVMIYALIYKKAKMVIVKSNKSFQNNYERTEKGNEIAEKINGLKKYINEFSLLSQREKEEVILWEDFLIYAVTLEENEKIIKDIFRYKNINMDIFYNLESIAKEFKNILKSLTANQWFDFTYNINLVAQIFCKLLKEGTSKLEIKDYYWLWYYSNNLNQEQKQILKNDIENILYETNSIDVLKRYDEIFLEIKENIKLRNKWEKYALTHTEMKEITYEDICKEINNIADLVKMER